MKWFDRLFNSESDSAKMMREDQERLKKFNEEKEKRIEEFNPEEFAKEIVEPEKPEIPTIDIEVAGSYEFDIIRRDEYFNFQSPYCIEFKYDVDIRFLNESFNVKSSFCMAEDFSDRRRMVSFHRDSLDRAYQYLDEIMEGDREEVMKELRYSISRKVKEYVDEKYIEGLKKKYEENKSFDINMTFKMEKPKNA